MWWYENLTNIYTTFAYTLFNVKKSRKENDKLSPIRSFVYWSYFKKKGHSVKIIDFSSEENPVETIIKYLPIADVVGINVYTDAREKVRQLAKIIKSEFLVPVLQFNKMRGLPFRVGDIENKIIEVLGGSNGK